MCIRDRLHRYKNNNGLSKGPDEGLRIIFWNAGGLNNAKFTELKTILYQHDADVFIIVEAGASTDFPQFYEVNNFTTHVLKRSRQVASGILVGVNKKHASDFYIVHEMEEIDKVEIIGLKIWISGTQYNIFGMYNPPNNKPSFDRLPNTAKQHNSIIIGDFNAHSNRWGYKTANGAGRATEELLDNSNLIRLNSDPTFLSFAGSLSTPDLAMVHSNLSARANLSLGDAHDGSGHRSLILKIAPKKRAPPYRQIPRWNFKKADWGQFCSISNNTITENLIDDNPDKSTDRFVNAVLLAAKRAVPRGQVKRYKPFWNAKLTELKANRDKARRKAESTNLQCDSIDLMKKQAQLKLSLIHIFHVCY